MCCLRDGDTITESLKSIERYVLDFYSSLYSSENVCLHNDLIEKVVPFMVMNAYNTMLTNVPK
uniref:Uncharacterized protein n=1 Tax=Cajanus cajan TaxID=3821 RepID=A0A151U3U6_CAJCA|nr:hypothetical protein KK1_006632 [Cajanus cajan]